MREFLISIAALWTGLWHTPDQLGQRQFQRGEFVNAATTFEDPLWQGSAWYRAGEFQAAARSFALRDSAEAQFNQGNAWLMLGKYETAISCYQRALDLKGGDLKEAIENKALATARQKMTEQKGGGLGDQQLGADKVIFDKDGKNEGQETTVTEEKALSQQEVQALWLRRVQTRPAEFLKSKFAFQEALRDEASNEISNEDSGQGGE